MKKVLELALLAWGRFRNERPEFNKENIKQQEYELSMAHGTGYTDGYLQALVLAGARHESMFGTCYKAVSPPAGEERAKNFHEVLDNMMSEEA